jgi:serine/threonine protein kinase
MLELIGEGTFGTVSKAMVHDHVVAAKRIKVDPSFMNREAEILGLLPSHPNLVDFYGSRRARTPKGETVEYLVMEYMPMNLRHFIISATACSRRDDEAFVPLATALCLAQQLFAGLSAVHALGVCHRDLKPENVLVGAGGTLKLCDFGSAKQLSRGGVAGVSYIGSRPYRAPELLCQYQRYTDAIDVWASGCIFAELLSGAPLFAAADNVAVLARQLKIRGKPTADWFVELCGNARAMDPFNDAKDGLGVSGPCKPWRNVLGRPASKEQWSPEQEAAVSSILDSLLAWAPSARPSAKRAVELFASSLCVLDESSDDSAKAQAELASAARSSGHLRLG